jgi:hypothetical protein
LFEENLFETLPLGVTAHPENSIPPYWLDHANNNSSLDSISMSDGHSAHAIFHKTYLLNYQLASPIPTKQILLDTIGNRILVVHPYQIDAFHQTSTS